MDSDQHAAGAPQQLPPSPAEAWKVHGRDSPAGKALYALYGGHSNTKTVGNQLHARNAQKHEQKLASGWRPPEVIEAPRVTPEKVKVAVPKFPAQRRTLADAGVGQYIPRRKGADQIRAELEEEYDRQRAARPPMPSGPLLDQAEKERCAALMQHRGKLPAGQVLSNGGVGVASAPRRNSSRRQDEPQSQIGILTAMFDNVVAEIDERQAHLASMEQLGQLKADVAANLRLQMAIRARELKVLDARIQAELANGGV